ncbi:MAG: sugar phosphate nucleotidyltransferase [Candidatus Omnitrophota bacterium]
MIFRKTISVFVIFTFLFSNVAFAVPAKSNIELAGNNETVTTPESIVVPRDFGLVKSKFNGNSGKLIVHIQDAHCNYEAQSNIVKILEGLVKNYSFGLVAVEGADGFIDTSWFKAFPDDEVRKEVADYFMKKGEITGPEFLSITTNLPFKLFGAETRSYYIQNLNAFTSSYPLKDETEKYFNSIKAVLNRLKGFIYSEELKVLDTKIQDYESKKLQFNDYIRFLQAIAEKHKINLRSYDNFFRLVSVLIYEKKIDFNITDKERSALIDELSKAVAKDQLQQLVTQSISFKSGKISSAEYYAYLKNLAAANGIDLSKKYPNLYNYIIYNAVYSKIENEKLFQDLKKIEIAVKEKLFANDDQRALEKLSRHIDILLGLINIKLMNGDFDYYQADKSEFTSEYFEDFIKKKVIQFGLAYDVMAPTEAVAQSIPKLEDFYSIAIKRDKALVDNTLDAMKKEKQNIAVLVTGGFHSEGIAKLLEKQGVSYMVVCPSITKDVPSPYIQILTNQRTPLEDILIGTAHAKEGMVAAPSRAQLITMPDSAFKDYVGRLEAGEKLALAIKAAEEEWVDVTVSGAEGAATPVGRVNIEGLVDRLKEDTGASIAGIVNELRHDLHQRCDRLHLSKISIEHLLALLEEKLTSPEFKAITDKFEAEYNERVANRAALEARRKGAAESGRKSPGRDAVAGIGERALRADEFGRYDSNLGANFEASRVETRDEELPGLRVHVHGDINGSFEEGIAAQNDDALLNGGATIPFPRVHPGTYRGSALSREIDGQIEEIAGQIHVSRYIWDSEKIADVSDSIKITKMDKEVVGNHEKAHLDIFAGKGDIFRLWLLYLEYCAIYKKFVDQEDFVDNIQSWVSLLTKWANKGTNDKGDIVKDAENKMPIKEWAVMNGVPLDARPGDFPNCNTIEIRKKIAALQALRIYKRARWALTNIDEKKMRIALTEAYVLAANYGDDELLSNIINLIPAQPGMRKEICGRAILQIAKWYPLWIRKDLFRTASPGTMELLDQWRTESGADHEITPKDVVAVIMAGGGGERMWPLSVTEDPKQITDIIDEKLLVMAVRRVIEHLGRKNVYIQTIPKLKDKIVKLLKDAGLNIPKENIFAEPESADTSGAIGYAAAKLKRLGRGNDVMFACTADHYIDVTSPDFRSAYMHAAKIAKHNQAIGTLGIDPEPIGVSEEYGCIRKGGETFYEGGHVAAKFIEKPKGKDAKDIFKERLPDNSHVWLYNSGMFIGRPDIFLEAFRQVAPVYGEAFDAIADPEATLETEAKAFKQLGENKKKGGFIHSGEPTGFRKGVSVDYVLAQPVSKMETDRIALFMVAGTFKWKDIGSYAMAYAYYKDDYLGTPDKGDASAKTGVYKDADNNIVVNKSSDITPAPYVNFESCSECFVIANDPDARITLKNLTRTIVIYNPTTKSVMVAPISVEGDSIKKLQGRIGARAALKGYVLGNLSGIEPSKKRAVIRGRYDDKTSSIVMEEADQKNNVVEEYLQGNGIIIGSEGCSISVGVGLATIVDMKDVSLDVRQSTADGINISVEKKGPAAASAGTAVSAGITLAHLETPAERIGNTRMMLERLDINHITPAAYAGVYGVSEDIAKTEIGKIYEEDIDRIIKIAAGISRLKIDRSDPAKIAHLDGEIEKLQKTVKDIVLERKSRGTLVPGWIRLVVEGIKDRAEYKESSRVRSETVRLCNTVFAESKENEILQDAARTEKERILKDKELITLSPAICRRDSVRAEDAELELSDTIANILGKSMVMLMLKQTKLTDPSKLKMVVGRESRITGRRILSAYKRGLLDMGANVLDISKTEIDTLEGRQVSEVVSTPLIYFANQLLNPSSATEITASHLPKAANGIKPTIMKRNVTADEMKVWEELTHDIIDGKIKPSGNKGAETSDASVLGYYHLMLSATLAEIINDESNAAGQALVNKWRLGRNDVLNNGKTLKQALDDIKNEVAAYMGSNPLCGMKMEIDPGNGSMGPIAIPLLIGLGAEIPAAPTHIPDGIFEGLGRHDSNPNIPDNLRILIRRVFDNKASMGEAFDADGDRLGVISSEGDYLQGDDIACLIAPVLIKMRKELTGKEPVVIVNNLCSDQLKQVIREAGGRAVECNVGFTNVKAKMTELRDQGNEAIMGVELSSHIMMDMNFDSDDAFFASIVLIGILKQKARELSVTPQEVMGLMRKELNARYFKVNPIGEGRVLMLTDDTRKEAAAKAVEECKRRIGDPEYQYIYEKNPDRETEDLEREGGIKIDVKERETGELMGWFVIRPSGTSAEIVVTAESVVGVHAESEANAIMNAHKIKQEVIDLLRPYERWVKVDEIQPSDFGAVFKARLEGKDVSEVRAVERADIFRKSVGMLAVGQADETPLTPGADEIIASIMEEVVVPEGISEARNAAAGERLMQEIKGSLPGEHTDRIASIYNEVVARVKAARLGTRIAAQETTAQFLATQEVRDVTVNGETGALIVPSSSDYKDRGQHDSTYMKLRGLAANALVSARKLFARHQYETVYSMNHGALPIPETLRQLASYNNVSPENYRIHDTFFPQVNPLFPGSIQYQVTGAHYQANVFDIKYVTEGKGLQYLVKVDRKAFEETGKVVVVDTIVQEMAPGKWVYALPGYIDIVVNKGALRFNDVSYELSPQELEKLENETGFKIDMDTNFYEKLPAKGMAHLFYMYNGETRVALNPEVMPEGNLNIRVMSAGLPTMAEKELKVGLMEIYAANPGIVQSMMSLRYLETVNEKMPFAPAMIQAIHPKETIVPESIDVLNSSAQEAALFFEALEQEIGQGNPIEFLPNVRCGRKNNQTWGVPVSVSMILEGLGARTRQEKEALVDRLKIDIDDVVSELWIGADMEHPSMVNVKTKYSAPVYVLFGNYPEETFGKDHLDAFGRDFGLLIKHLNSARYLSAQNHVFTEGVIPLNKESVAVMGFARDIGPQELEEELIRGKEESLNRVVLMEGKPYLVPKGMMHAYGPVNVLEIKEQSLGKPDTGMTNSIYDRLSVPAGQKTPPAEWPTMRQNNPAELAKAVGIDSRRTGKDVLTMAREAWQRALNVMAENNMLKEAKPQDYESPVINLRPQAIGGKLEGMMLEPGFVVERFEIHAGQTMLAEELTFGRASIIMVQEGAVDLTTEKDVPITTLKAKTEDRYRLNLSAYPSYKITAAQGRKAIVDVMYKPLPAEALVNTGFEAIRANLPAVRSQKVHLLTTSKAFRRGDVRDREPGSFRYEKEILNRVSDGRVELSEVISCDAGELKEALQGLMKGEEGVNYVVQLTEGEFNSIKDDKDIARLLKDTRLMVLPNVKLGENRGIPFIREIESAGVILGNTKPEDIRDKTAIAGWLKTVMSKLTGNKAIDWEMLATLLKSPDPAMSFADRISILLKNLQVRIQPHKADEGVRERRQLLWSV